MNKTVFKQKVENILMDNRRPKLREREKSGLINLNRLGRFGATNRLFKKRSIEKEGKDYSVTLLMDASGSMGGSKADMCVQAVQQIGEALSEVKGIEFQVYVFNGVVFELKSFDAPFDAHEVSDGYYDIMHGSSAVWARDGGGFMELEQTLHTRRFNMHNPEGRGWYRQSINGNANFNSDGYAVYSVMKSMQGRRGKKVMLTFSDGQPTHTDLTNYVEHFSRGRKGKVSFAGDTKAIDFLIDNQDYALKKAVAYAHKNGVMTFGVGIQDRYVSQFYDKYVIVDDLRKLFEKTVLLLSTGFKKENI